MWERICCYITRSGSLSVCASTTCKDDSGECSHEHLRRHITNLSFYNWSKYRKTVSRHLSFLQTCTPSSNTHKHCCQALLLVLSIILGSMLPLVPHPTPSHCWPGPLGPLYRRQPGHLCTTLNLKTCSNLRDQSVNFLFLWVGFDSRSRRSVWYSQKAALDLSSRLSFSCRLFWPGCFSLWCVCFLLWLSDSALSSCPSSLLMLVREKRASLLLLLLRFQLLLRSQRHWLTQCRLLEHQ